MKFFRFSGVWSFVLAEPGFPFWHPGFCPEYTQLPPFDPVACSLASYAWQQNTTPLRGHTILIGVCYNTLHLPDEQGKGAGNGSVGIKPRKGAL
jgi:hypothetical protein